jgi:hypothetical protein
VSLSTPACSPSAAQQYTGFGTQETIQTISAHDKSDHIRETRNLPQPKGLIPGLAQALTGAKKRRAKFGPNATGQIRPECDRPKQRGA